MICKLFLAEKLFCKSRNKKLIPIKVKIILSKTPTIYSGKGSRNPKSLIKKGYKGKKANWYGYKYPLEAICKKCCPSQFDKVVISKQLL
jgi:hypothetical protein